MTLFAESINGKHLIKDVTKEPESIQRFVLNASFRTTFRVTGAELGCKPPTLLIVHVNQGAGYPQCAPGLVG